MVTSGYPRRSYSRVPANDRFEQYVMADPNSGCWLWTGGLQHNGYGSFTDDEHRSCRAHRFSWERKNGPIPSGLLLCHKCDTRTCVNPDHLFLGNARDNLRDASDKGRLRKHSLAHCPKGHEFTPKNTMVSKYNLVSCRRCKNDRAKAWRHAKGISKNYSTRDYSK